MTGIFIKRAHLSTDSHTGRKLSENEHRYQDNASRNKYCHRLAANQTEAGREPENKFSKTGLRRQQVSDTWNTDFQSTEV